MMINFKFLGVKQIHAFSTSSLWWCKPDLDNNSVDIKPVIKYDNACEDKLKILKPRYFALAK